MYSTHNEDKSVVAERYKNFEGWNLLKNDSWW